MKRGVLLLLLVGCSGAFSTRLLREAGPGDDASSEEDDASMPDMDASSSMDARKDAKDSAPPPPTCQQVCPMNGGTCVNNTCVIDCGMGANGCPTPVVCPKGVPCKVICGGYNSCAGGVNCTQASSCEIQCNNASACGGKISCGGSSCSVACFGTSSCNAGIDCSAQTCNLSCSGTSSCGAGKVTCTGSDCTVNCGFVACGAGVCCQATKCNVMGAPNGC